MIRWHEFRLWYSSVPTSDRLFEFKRSCLLPLLEKLKIDYFLVLDEPEFMLLRMECEEEFAKQTLSLVNETIVSQQAVLFSKATLESWSPQADARSRVLEARKRAEELGKSGKLNISFVGVAEGGWKVSGLTDRKWDVASEDLDRQTEAFSRFMSNVAGAFTKSYLKEMPYRVDDRWLTSVFIHLLLDSISTWQVPESESRGFPYV